MKNVLKVLAVALVVVMLGAVLVACNAPSGTYKSKEVLSAQTTYKFSGSKYTATFKTALGSSTEEGKFKVAKDDDGNLQITFTPDSDKAAYTLPFAKETKDADGNKYITIGLVSYYKD